MKVTKQEFAEYVRVQMSGLFNMFNPHARLATGLSREKYLYIIKNYAALKEKYGIGKGKKESQRG